MNSHFKPRLQGNLDSLCGPYFVVNAVGALSRGQIGCDGAKGIFGVLTRELAKRSRLAGTLEPDGGVGFRQVGKLLDVASSFLQLEHGMSIDRAVASKSYSPSLGSFWNSMARHVAQHGRGSVILGLGGKHRHWTCVGEVSECRISLIDSGGLKFIPRERATVGWMRGKRHHELWATQTYFLRLVSTQEVN